jgi:hypothetical protein
LAVIRSRAEFDRWSAFALASGFPLEVSAKPYKPTRTSEQNAYLFGVCYPPIAEAKGYTVDDIHEWMCGTHFGWVDEPCPKTPNNPQGIRSRPFRTTTRDHEGKRNVLNKVEFSAFVDTVHRIASQAGIFIPDAIAA